MVKIDSVEKIFSHTLTSLHPIEWLARHVAEYNYEAYVGILFCTEVNPASLSYIKRTLEKDGITLDFLEE